MAVDTPTNPQSDPDAGKTAAQLWDEELAASDKTDAAGKTEPTPAAAPAETPTPKPAPKTEPAPAEADPYAGLNPVVRAELEEAKKLRDRLRNVEGHIGGLNTALKRTQDELEAAKQAAASVKEAPSAAAVAAAQQSTEKWDQLKSEFPEWAEALEERLGSHAQPDLAGLRSQIREELTQQLTTDLTTKIKADIAADTESRLVNVAHRGWTETVKTQAFTDWYAKQADDVKAWGASPRAEDAIALLDSFKASTATAVDADKIRQTRKSRLQEAANVARGVSNARVVKSVDDMTNEEYWNYLAANPQARRR